jgi:hypothetical protein
LNDDDDEDDEDDDDDDDARNCLIVSVENDLSPDSRENLRVSPLKWYPHCRA